MTGASETSTPVAVVCGSESLAGGAVTIHLRDGGWDVFTIDPPGAVSHPAAHVSVQGEIWERAPWIALATKLRASGKTPRVFVHAFDNAGDTAGSLADRALRSAELGSRHLMPLMADGGAIAFVTSVLAGWDTRAGLADFSAGQAGILALMRSLAVAGGSSGIRANVVCTGLVTARPDDVPATVRERIPLGRSASPDDVADAVLFFLSADAVHISGSTLVVDGGQSLQSWSNAPRLTLTPLPPSPIAMGEGGTRGGTRRFQDRIVVITGAAGGLGSAAARRFAAEGASLALLDRDRAEAERLAMELGVSGHDVLAIAVDVANEQSIAQAIAQTEKHFGRIDVLFNNAGVGGGDHAIAEMPAADWDAVIAVNLRGVFLGCKYGVPALMRAGGGAIVNMGSSTGRHDTITGGAAYMASKAAVEAMTKSLALQVASHGIRANTICPGIIETQLSFRQQERGDPKEFFAEFASRIPRGRVGQPEDVAAAVAFLASDQARHITGASLLIDGGQTLRKWISAPDLDFAFDEEVSQCAP
ncbi:MAG: SDR family oxidoreductase [Chloroflexota bacterium]|nr:SDR family oxidoreductase [Chloroflexota bacterium]